MGETQQGARGSQTIALPCDGDRLEPDGRNGRGAKKPPSLPAEGGRHLAVVVVRLECVGGVFWPLLDLLAQLRQQHLDITAAALDD